MDSINDLPLEERPQYRMRQYGAETLSDAELLCLALGKTNITKVRMLLRDGLSSIAKNPKEPKLAAVVELTRRIRSQDFDRGKPVGQPDDLAAHLIAMHSHKPQEELGVVLLNSRNIVLHEAIVYRGTINSASVSTRDPIRLALEWNAVGMIVFHQHPSGDPCPSSEDILFTRKLAEACKLVDVDLLDHIVLGHNRFVSFKKQGFI